MYETTSGLVSPPTPDVWERARIRPRLRRRRAGWEVLELLVLILGIYTLVNLATVRFIVEGPSMEPTLHTDQFLVVSRVKYLLDEPERGDLVVFHFPGNVAEDYVKRLIALPGDTIEFREQQVYVNGTLLNEPYINEPCRPVNCPDVTYVMEADEYFLMGDNRNRSSDSRIFEQRGQVVQRQHIVGEVVLRYWPPADAGVIIRKGYPE